MTKSNKESETITITLTDDYDIDDLITEPISITDYTATIDTSFDMSGITFDTTSNNHYSFVYEDNKLDPVKIEKMCKEYPSLEKVWNHFKSVYDMCEQDYKGKVKAGEIDDDDIPF